MAERERRGSTATLIDSPNGDGRVLVTAEQVKTQLNTVKQQLLPNPILDLSDTVRAISDYFIGRFEWLDMAFLENFKDVDLPKGNGEAVVLETGLLEIPLSFLPLSFWLGKINYKPVVAPHPYVVNFEILEKRAERLLEVSRKCKDSTDKKVKWVLWSKATLTGMHALVSNPEEVAELVDHIAFLGIPLECDLNTVVGRAYLATQVFNRIVFGKNDFDFVESLNSKTEIKIPEGIDFTIIDSKNNGISVFNRGDFPNMFLVDGSHSALPSNKEGFIKLSRRFAGLAA